MHFEVSERFRSNQTSDVVWNVVIQQFSKVGRVKRGIDGISVESVEATFGSINRSDTTTVRLAPRDGGYLITAEVSYRPSLWFWLFTIAGFFGVVAWVLPLAFYLYQKGTVRRSIEGVLKRVRDDVESFGASFRSEPLGATA